jgi:two-component system, sporulation sensor kinase E
MTRSNFLTTLQKKIDKLDIQTIKTFIYELIEENENLKTIFNSMKEAVLVIDNDSSVIYYNKMAVSILEFSSKNFSGLHFNEIIKNQNFINLISDAIRHEERIDDHEMLLELSASKYISLSLHPLVSSGKIIGSIIIINDITAEKENKNRLKLAENLAALTSISAGIAHEIKNPLGAISIHVQLLEDELKRASNENSNIQFSLNVVKEEITRLNNIIIDYLMTVRPLRADLMLTNLKDFLDEFSDFILPELNYSNIIFKKKYAKLPDVWLDARYFKQALLNLIKNSIAAIKEDGKEDGRIEIEAFEKQNYVIINIIDNGEGIPEEIQTKIFDPYFTTKDFGTGLGLTIVYKIVKEHRGEISFKSKKSRTVFSIKLPLSYIESGLIEYSGEENEHKG